jgi:hypothetical protein
MLIGVVRQSVPHKDPGVDSSSHRMMQFLAAASLLVANPSVAARSMTLPKAPAARKAAKKGHSTNVTVVDLCAPRHVETGEKSETGRVYTHRWIVPRPLAEPGLRQEPRPAAHHLGPVLHERARPASLSRKPNGSGHGGCKVPVIPQVQGPETLGKLNQFTLDAVTHF